MNMENSEFSKEKSKLELFQEEFGSMIEKEKEKQKKGEKYNPHLVGIKKEELNQEDAEVWEKFINRVLTFPELSKFRSNVISRVAQKTERIEPTSEELAVYEKYKRGEINKEEFMVYWKRETDVAEFWNYWGKKIGNEQEEKFGDSEENFYAYLDNEIEGDKFWLKKFRDEQKKAA